MEQRDLPRQDFPKGPSKREKENEGFLEKEKKKKEKEKKKKKKERERNHVVAADVSPVG